MASKNPFAGLGAAQPGSPTGSDQRLFSSTSPAPRPEPPATPIPTKEGSREVGKEGSREASQPAAARPARRFDLNEKGYRKDSYLLTNEEFEGLEDLKIELKRKFDLPATKNDLARAALQHLMEDYERNGEASVAVRRLRKKTSK
jgi:hypothetical protein